MACTLRDDRIQFVGSLGELGHRQVTQCLDPKMPCGLFTLCPAGIVFAIHQAPAYVRVDDDHINVGWHAHRTGIQTAAIDQQSMILLTQSRDELIHDAAVATDEPVFRQLSIQGDICLADVEVIHLFEDLSYCHFQRGGRAQACSLRYIATDYQVCPCQLTASQ